MRIGFLMACLWISSSVGYAQENGLDSNRPYEDFAKAYKTLNAKTILDIYVKDAVLLNLYDGSNPNSIKGVENIKTFFETFFKKSTETGQQLKLEFKIIDRQQEGNTIYDNGFYKLSSTAPNQPDRIGYGKLSTVMVYDQDRWKFKVDSNTNTTKEEFENAEVGSVPQPK